MMDVYVCEYVCKRVSALHTVVEEVSRLHPSCFSLPV